jgi:membrane-associated phospholipid phosphatase
MKLNVAWDEFARDLPVLLVVVSLFMSILTWDPAVMLLLVVIFVNVIVACVLKRIIKQERPKQSCIGLCSQMGAGMSAGAGGDRWGMPSGHTQVTVSFFTFAIFLLVWRVLPSVPKEKAWKKWAIKYVTIPIFALAPILVAAQRVHSKCHSVAQVLVAAVLGVAIAIAAALLARHLLKRMANSATKQTPCSNPEKVL